MKLHHPRRFFGALATLVALAAVWHYRAPASPVTPMPPMPAAAAAAPAPMPQPDAVIPPELRNRAIIGTTAAVPAEPRARFDAWSQRYLARPAAERAALVDEGRELAAARRTVLAEMIRTDPRAALAAAVPMVVRQKLPPEIVALLEERVAGRGVLAFNGVTPVPGQTVPEATFRTAQLDDQTYRAHVFGRRDVPATVMSSSMHGIALDGHLAVAESPLRVLEPGEMSADRPLDTVCGISGQDTAVGPNTPLNTSELTAVEYNGVVHVLCGANHLAQTEARLQSTEKSEVAVAAAAGPGSSDVIGRPAYAWTHGQKKLLIIRVDFSDRPGTPVETTGGTALTEDRVSAIVGTVKSFYAENSLGQTELVCAPAVNGDSPDVSPVIRMAQPSAYYFDNGGQRIYELHDEARAAAAASGINVSTYDRVGVVHSYDSRVWWAGLAYITGPYFWINGYFDLRVLSHEIGHNYGLSHANYWQPVNGDPVSPAGYNVEYGDAMDVMGSGPYANYHFTHWNKSILQWIPDSAVTTVETPGIYRIHRFDGDAANPANARALKIKRDDTRDFWIGYRGGMPLGTAPTGAYVLWGYHSNQSAHLLNVSRRTSNSTYESPLPVGESFTDNFSGVTMRTVAAGGSGADKWLDVEIGFTPRVQWSQTTDYNFGEQDGTVTLRVVRAGSTDTAMSVTYATTDGSAVAGNDYTSVAGTLTWAAGDATERQVTVPLLSDAIWEGRERFTVTLQNASGGTIGGFPAAGVGIVDAGLRDDGFAPDIPLGRVHRVLFQPDGTMVVAGQFDGVRDPQQNDQPARGIAKLTADGRFVPAFTSGGGLSRSDHTIYDIAQQPDGRFVIVGDFTSIHGIGRQFIARLNADGSVDSTFMAITDKTVRAIVALPDGRMLIAGEFSNVNGIPREYVARLNADGSLDQTFVGPHFGNPGLVMRTLAVQPDGRVLLGGVFVFFEEGFLKSSICRLMPDGARDTSFQIREGAHMVGNPNLNGTVRTIVVQPDNRILVGGKFTAYNNTPHGGIVRLNPDGTIDSSFTLTTDGTVNATLPLPDGRLVIGGLFNTVNSTGVNNVALIEANGTVSPVGGFSGELHNFQITPNGRVQFCGFFNPYQNSSDWRPIWRMMSGLANLPGTVQLAAASAHAAEGGNLTVSVTRTGGTAGPITVGYATAPGTASGADFTASSGILTWANGDATSKTISIPLTSDSVTESNETFTVGLGAPVIGGAALGGVRQATLTIDDSAPPPPPPPGTWQAGDVGATGATGSSSESGGTVTMSGAGADIWGAADAFQFRSQPITGDGSIIVRVASTGSTHPWAKVGIMFRENLTAGSREVMAFVTPGNHSGLQYRLEPGAQSAMGADTWSGMPVWLMLVRSGDTFGGYRSYDGENWTPLGTINCDLPDTAYVGLAVSSHVTGTLLTATFDNVEVSGTEPPPPPPGNPPAAPDHLSTAGATASTVSLTWRDNSTDETGFAIERSPGFGDNFAEIATVAANSQAFMDTGLTANTTYSYRIRAFRGSVYSAYSEGTLITTNNNPPGWQGLDIGNVGPGGDQTVAEPTITMRAGGADIWGTADGFRFVYRSWTGDGEIRARVASLTNTHPWAKAGVMFRESLGAGSRNVAYLLTAANASGLQARAVTGGETSFTTGPWANAPYWVRLVRAGDTFTAFTSPDGLTWTQQGTQTVAMGATIYVGVAASAHTTTQLTTAVFESVQLPDGPPPPPPPPPPPGDWTLTKLGTATGSFTTPATDAVTVTGTGADYYNAADDGLFVQRAVSGDGEIIARLDSLTNTHPWAKAGIMFRESLAANAANVFVGLTPGNGAFFQVRTGGGGATTELQHNWAPGAPCWLKLTRAGSTFTAAFSTNGTTWVALGSTTLTLPNNLYAGLAASSHASASTTATFSAIQVPGGPPPPPPPPPPSDWQQASWGTATGSFTKTGTPSTSVTIDVTATGADIWGQADDGFYVNQVWQGSQGDGVMVTRVESMTNTHPWAKAGLMFRETTTANSPNVFLALTPGVGVTLQVRSSAGAVTTEAQHSWAAGVPCYLRLSRNFDRTLTAEFSADGTNWTLLGTVADPLTRSTNIYGGVGVSSHTGTATSVRFTGVSMQWAI